MKTPPAHASMPEPVVKVITRVWEETQRRSIWSFRPSISTLELLLASEAVAKQAKKALRKECGQEVIEALVTQAAYVPKLWAALDKRTRARKLNYLRKVQVAIDHLLQVLEEDRATLTLSTRIRKGVETTKKPMPESFELIDSRSPSSDTGLLDNIVSDPFSLKRILCEPPRKHRDLPEGKVYRMSFYSLERALRGFEKPLRGAALEIERGEEHNLRELHHAVYLLDDAVQGLNIDFDVAGLKRNALVTAFVKALYHERFSEDQISLKRVHEIRQRRSKADTEGKEFGPINPEVDRTSERAEEE